MNTNIVFNTEPEYKSRKYFMKSISEKSSRIPGVLIALEVTI